MHEHRQGDPGVPAPAEIDAIIADGLERFTDATITDGRKLKSELKLIRARGYAVDEASTNRASAVSARRSATGQAASSPA